MKKMNQMISPITTIWPAFARAATLGVFAGGRVLGGVCDACTSTAAVIRDKSVLTQGDVAFGHVTGPRTWRPLTG